MVKRIVLLATVAVLLLACLGGGMGVMDKCKPEMVLILSDGAELPLHSGSGYVAGSAASVVGLQGFGLPPVEHVTQEIYQMPGVTLRGVNVGPRVVDVVLSLWSTDGTRYGLHRTRAQLLDAFRWDRGATDTALTTLRYTLNGVSRELYLTFDGVVESQLGRYGLNETWAVRFLCPDPTWHSDTESSQPLDYQDILAMRLVVAREAGVWNAMGPPVAVAAGIVATDIYAAAVDPLTGDVYFGGDFTNFNNVGLADFLVRRRAGIWEAVGDDGVGGPALTERVECLYFGPDNLLYVGGRFVNAGGVAAADYIAVVDPVTDVWAAPAAGPNEVAGRIVYDVVIASDGYLYVTGNFTNWSGLGSPAGDYIARAPLGGAWATVGNGLNGMGYCLAKAPNGDLVVGGAFTTAGGVAHNRIAWRDLSAGAWVAMEGGFPAGAVWNAEFAPDGTLYVTGNIPQMGSAAATAYNFVKWNGSQWSNCGTGLNNIGYGLVVDSDGSAYVTGAFTTAGGLVVDRLGRWNGHAWAYLDIVLPVTGNIYRGIAIAENGDLYLGCREVGNATVAGHTAIVNLGDAATLPIIVIEGGGDLKTIVNETTGAELMFNLSLEDGEELVIDLSSGAKSCESSWRGNCLGWILPGSDYGFSLESHPRAAAGSNLITAFITNPGVATTCTIRWTPRWWSLDAAIS